MKKSSSDIPFSVTVAALTRFHIFSLAQQLAHSQLLRKLITGYPGYRMRSWPKLAPQTLSIPSLGLCQQILVRSAPLLGEGLEGVLRHELHRSFAKAVSRNLDTNTDILIGLSSFSLEAINRLRSKGGIAIVDHGSMHLNTEREILEPECQQYGFKPFGDWRHDWMRERMAEEFEAADHVFCCSELAKQTMVSHGVSEKKIFANPLGIDLQRFCPRRTSKEDHVFRIVCVGAMTPRKGTHYLVKAFERAQIPNAELWFIGAPPTDRILQEIVSDSCSRNSRILVKGSFPESHLPSVYQQCDLFVLPSLSDGWGMVVLQAMACGLPVIVTEMTGSKEVVEHGVSGWVIPSRNVDVLAAQLVHAHDDQDALIAMGRRARSRVQNGFSWDDYGARLVQWLEDNVR